MPPFSMIFSRFTPAFDGCGHFKHFYDQFQLNFLIDRRLSKSIFDGAALNHPVRAKKMRADVRFLCGGRNPESPRVGRQLRDANALRGPTGSSFDGLGISGGAGESGSGLPHPVHGCNADRGRFETCPYIHSVAWRALMPSANATGGAAAHTSPGTCSAQSGRRWSWHAGTPP